MKFSTLLATFLFFFPFFSEAWHIIGGEIYYTYLGGNSYEITLKVYRDCNSSTPFDDPAVIGVYTASGLLVQTLLVPFPGANSIDPDLTNPCLQVPPGVCVEEAIYKTVTSLSPAAEGYNISYQRCCRNNTIVNLYDPANTGATFTTHIPATNVIQGNSSPRFKNYPPIIICVDQVLEFDHSATDPNGDSLVYSLCTPLQGADANVPLPNPPPPPPYDPVVWQPPYNLNNQIGGNPVMSIDPHTGMLSGYPTALGQFVVGVCVKEYRNGEYLSQDVRDFQFNITTCNPLIVANFDVNGSISVNDTLLICGSYTADFKNQSFGSPFYSWDFGVPGIVTDVSSETNPVYVYPDTGVYKVVLFAALGQMCGDSVSKYVEIRKGITPDFTVVSECVQTPLSFNDQSTPIDGYVASWLWDFGDGVTSIEEDPLHSFSVSGFHQVSLTVKNNYGCISSVIKQVEVFPVPHINARPDTFVCSVDTVTLHAQDGVSYLWLPDLYLDDNTIASPKVNPKASTVYTVTVTNQYGCMATDSVVIKSTDSVIAATSPDVSICEGQSTQLTSSGAVYYSWSPDYRINDTDNANPFVYPDVTTSYYVQAAVGSCIDEDTVVVTVLPLPEADAGEDVTINQGESSQLNTTGTGNYLWSPPDALDDATISNPLASPLNTITYQVTVSSSNGCKASDSVTVTVTHNHLFLVPNAFTPNGDGMNDFFQFFTKGISEIVSVKVFNRWGQEVYQSTSGNDNGWDGFFHTVPCEMGTYIYNITGITYDGNLLSEKGALTLLR